MKITGDQALVKKINTALILDTIRLHAPISRADVAEMTGLNKATVSKLVNDLIENQLVSELGPGQSSGGRKPLMLLFNRHAGYAIGINLDVDRCQAMLCDLSGQIVIDSGVLQLQSTDPASVLDVLCGAIDHLMSQMPDSPYQVIGIGVGVPGMVDEDGTIQFAPNLGWENVPLQAWLQERYPEQIIAVENEANTGAIGELRYDAGQSSPHLIYVSVGAGIGTGIIVGGELLRGAFGYSVELGHMTIEANGRKCSCGNRGCWELYASEKALLDERLKLPFATLEEAIRLAETDDPAALHALQQIGEYLGIGLTNLVNAFNPQLIIIGNKLAHSERWLRSALSRTVQQRALRSHQSGMRIEFSSLGSYAAALGAANLVISSFIGRAKVSV
ncbi:ROK family protein [Paenibacillus marinisediminis]